MWRKKPKKKRDWNYKVVSKEIVGEIEISRWITIEDGRKRQGSRKSRSKVHKNRFEQAKHEIKH